MKRTYILLAVIGTILPNIFVVKESIENQNYLLYTDPVATFQGMFANNICSAFAIDLLFIVFLFLAWSYKEATRLGMSKVYFFWIYTFAFGIAGGLPLFLYFRNRKMELLTNSLSA